MKTFKKYIVGFLVLAISLGLYSLTNAPEKPMASKVVLPLMIEYTSTGCPGCGGWGKPVFNKLRTDLSERVVPLAAHIKYGDPMITDISNDLAANRLGQKYTPQIAINRENAVVIQNGIQHQASIDKINRLIEKYSSIEAPGLGALIRRDGQKIKVETVVDFSDFALQNKSINLAVYLTEDNVKNRQAGSHNNPETHNHVIRAAATGSFGKRISPANLNKDKKIFLNHEFDLKEYQVNPQNTYVTLVIWQEASDGFYPLNSRIVR